jgi:hypothetical protein
MKDANGWFYLRKCNHLTGSRACCKLLLTHSFPCTLLPFNLHQQVTAVHTAICNMKLKQLFSLYRKLMSTKKYINSYRHFRTLPWGMWEGESYLVMAMGYFTKWPEVCARPNQEASTVLHWPTSSATSGYQENCTATRVRISLDSCRRCSSSWK